jgi:2-haloacid dehalogenase
MTEMPHVLRREIKVLAFDQYGTIVDMQKGLTEAVTPLLKRKGWHGEPNSFVTWWRRTHFENSMIDALCDREPTPHRQIGRRGPCPALFRIDRAAVWSTAQIEQIRSCAEPLYRQFE